jgi:hypothetical protein
MMLNGSMILDLLGRKPGRYILRTMAHYGMQEADGAEVDCPTMLLTAARIEELMDANQLVRDGANKYRLPGTASHF